MSVLSRFVDERFLEHRRRSTSLAGIISAVTALGLFEYRLIVLHVVDWNLFAVGVTFVAVKVILMVWYARNR